jgi:hypothetical protein
MAMKEQNRSMIKLTPITLAAANKYVNAHHRHHKGMTGHKFSVACSDDDGTIVGVAIIGRPVARLLDDGRTLEVTRLCTNGAKNACSMLYSAAWRAAKAMGYSKMITYTLESESGTSLKAAGWRCVGLAGGGTWNRKSRPRADNAPICKKIRWEIGA